MTDLITSGALTVRHLHLPRIRLHQLGIGAKITAVSTSITEVICMAYVEPFNALRRRPSILNDFDMEGRDPNW